MGRLGHSRVRALRGYESANGRYRVFGTNGPIGRHDEALCPHGSVIIGRKGAYRGIHYSGEPFFVIDTAFYLKPKAEIDTRWAYYELLTHDINSMDSGSAIPSTSRESFYRLPVLLPPPEEQRAIASILGTLDDKIELNRRMNETLEAMARAIFKSWFVDFDPVRAKPEGRDPGLPKHIADLFPDRFEDSEVGEIPKGWEVGSVYDIADVVYGAPFASSQFNTEGLGKPLIRIRDLANETPGVWTPEVHPKGYKVRPGDIVVGMDGEFRAYLWGGAEAWLNQRVCVFLPNRGASAAFVRNSIIEPLAHVEATETATTVIHLGKGDIDLFSVVVPTALVLMVFNDLCQPWYDRIVVTKRESRTLAALRDTLLPKLIAGEVRVKNVERFAGPVSELLETAQNIAIPVNTEPGSLAKSNSDRMRSSIDDFDTTEVMAAFRQAARELGTTTREELLKAVSQRLGFERHGSHIDESLRGHLRAAIRRKIIGSEGAELVFPETATMAHYYRDELVDFLLSAMRRGSEYEREDVIRDVATYLGFSRVTDSVAEPIRSAINGAIRRGLLDYRGNLIWRIDGS
jgi:type I restriction enzyme S subunit